MAINYFFRKIKYLSLFPIIFLFIGAVFSYDNIITHPQITEAAIKIYQNQSSKILTGEQANWIIEGSIDEDTFPRYLNHYFNPTTGKGLDDYDETLKQNFTGISAKEWAKNQSNWVGLSGDYSDGAILKNYREGNLKRAYQGIGHILHLAQDMSVPAHTRNDSHAGGDPYENWAKQNGKVDLSKAKFIAINNLDQVFDELALFSHNNFFSKDTAKIENLNNYKKIRKFENGIEVEYLINTINGRDYYLAYSKNPNADNPIYNVENDQVHADYWKILHPKAIGYSAGAIEYFINQFKKIDEEKANQNISLWNKTKRFFSNLDDNSKYLAGDIVIGATNTIYDVYIDTKETIDFAKSIFSNFSPIDPMASVANIGQIANDAAISLPGQGDEQLAINLPGQGNQQLPIDDQQSAVGNEQLTISSEQPVVISNEQLAISLPAQTGNQQPVQIQQPEIIHAPYQRSEVIHAPYGGDSGGGDSQQIQGQTEIQNQNISEVSETVVSTSGSFVGVSIEQNDSQSTENTTTSNQSDTQQIDTQTTGGENVTLPATPIIATNNGQNLIIQKFASQYPERNMNFTLEGTKETGISKIIINNTTDTVDSELTTWQKEVVLLEGENIFTVAAEDDLGNISDSATIKISLQFDNSTFYLTDYDVRKMDFTLNWGDTNGVIKEWELEYKFGENFDWIYLANSSSLIALAGQANSFDFTAKYDDMIYQFRLRGSDASGNLSDYQYLNAEISTKPVVINEIAWMGTTASAYDEWIELANKTGQEIDLVDWTLKTTDGNIDVKLTVKIAPYGFYLLERAINSEVGTIDEDNAVSNIAADQIYPGALTNRQYPNEPGQNLKLLDKENIEIDDVWTLYAGDNTAPEKRVSERINIWSPSTYKNNWQNYLGQGGDALDANGNPVYGTPRAKNSQADKYFSLNGETIPTINKDTIFLKSRGPYMASGSVQIMGGVNLTIEPGTELNFNSFGLLSIYDGSHLIAKGVENNKITVKSSTSSGTAIFILNSTAEIDNVEMSGGSITIDNSNVVISNSVIKNAPFGLITLSNNSIFNISNSEFSGDRPYDFSGNYYSGEAILIKQSQGNVKSSIIKNNRGHGIYVDSLSGTLDISGNNFSSNGIAPIATNGFIDLNLEDNTIGANDALTIYNPIVKAGEEATISSQIPYLLYTQAKDNAQYKIGDPEIKAGGTLKIEPGAIVKFNTNSFLKVYGKLEAIGALEQPIIFMQQWDPGSYNYNDMISGSISEIGESDQIKFYDGSEAILENVITRQKSVDQYKSYWLVR